MKKSILWVALVMCVVILSGCSDNKGNVSNVNHVIGYSALYNDKLINEAFSVVEKKFSEDFEGCTLTELRYDDEVENRFAYEIMTYATEKNQKLIVLLSTFDTDEKGGDGSFNPNETYTNWQWHLVRTTDKKSWEIIDWGWVAKPSVMIDGVLYGTTGSSPTYRTDDAPENGGHVDGVITSSVAEHEYPVEDDQSNFGAGYYYRYGENNTIEVFSDSANNWVTYEAYEDQ